MNFLPVDNKHNGMYRCHQVCEYDQNCPDHGENARQSAGAHGSSFHRQLSEEEAEDWTEVERGKCQWDTHQIIGRVDLQIQNFINSCKQKQIIFI